MIIDSNVVLRFLRNDVAAQAKLAAEFFQKVENGDEKGEISILVLNEVIWALGQQYKVKRPIFLRTLIKILAIKNIEVIEADKEMVCEIFEKMTGNKIDFTDYYLATISSDGQVFSFDKDLKKLK